MKRYILIGLFSVLGAICIRAQTTDTINGNTEVQLEKNSFLHVYPDAVAGTLKIIYASNTKDPPPGWGGKLQINVLNASGKIVYTETIIDFEGDYTKIVDLSNEEKGSYIVEVYAGNKGKVRKEVFVSTTAPEERPEDNSVLSVFPNPTDGTFQIVYASNTKNPPDGWGGKLVITILDPYSKVVYEETILNFEGEYNKTIDLNSGVKGTYVIEILSGNRGHIKREVLK